MGTEIEVTESADGGVTIEVPAEPVADAVTDAVDTTLETALQIADAIADEAKELAGRDEMTAAAFREVMDEVSRLRDAVLGELAALHSKIDQLITLEVVEQIAEDTPPEPATVVDVEENHGTVVVEEIPNEPAQAPEIRTEKKRRFI